MNIGGVVAKLGTLKNQKPTEPCDRCGLRYVKAENESCPHCGSLSDFEVENLKERLENEEKGNNTLGKYFIIGAVFVAFLMLVIGLG